MAMRHVTLLSENEISEIKEFNENPSEHNYCVFQDTINYVLETLMKDVNGVESKHPAREFVNSISDEKLNDWLEQAGWSPS